MAISGVCEACGRKTMNVQMSVSGFQMICSSCSTGQVHGVIRPNRIARLSADPRGLGASKIARFAKIFPGHGWHFAPRRRERLLGINILWVAHTNGRRTRICYVCELVLHQTLQISGLADTVTTAHDTVYY